VPREEVKEKMELHLARDFGEMMNSTWMIEGEESRTYK